MGAIYDALEGHEGYAMRRLPAGTVTSSWTVETAPFGSYVAACKCDWRGGDHPPTSAGYEDAVDEWDRSHAQPLVARAIPANVQQMLHEIKQALADLVIERPAAGLKAVHDVEAWAKAIGARGMSPEQSPTGPDAQRPNGNRLRL